MGIRTSLAFLIFFFFCSLPAQNVDKIMFENFVECFYADTTESLNIYDAYEGKIIARLEPYGRFCWYKIAITESRGEWMKIENINVVPCDDETLSRNQEKHKHQWVKSEHLRLHLTNNGGPIYRTADANSRVVLDLKKGIVCKVLAVDGNWAKVSLLYKKKLYVGWIEKFYQCPLPYTTCNWNEPISPAKPRK